MAHIGLQKSRRLVADIVAARHDIMDLAKRHKLEPEDLAEWIANPANQQILNGLCMLADVQTQVLLSRYRLVAAGKLINLASPGEQGEPVEPNLSRRACVDLLRLELKRADVGVAEAQEAGLTPDLMRKMLYDAQETGAASNESEEKEEEEE